MSRLLRYVALCAVVRVSLAQLCSGPEPTWLTSSWWPAGAVFRCGCGFAQGGAVSQWNNVVVCKALGDLYYATGGPNWVSSKGISWQADGGFTAAASGLSTNYCYFDYGTTLRCSYADTGLTPGGAVLRLSAQAMAGTIPVSFMELAALNDFRSISFTGNPDLAIDPALFAPFMSLTSLSMSSTSLSGTIPASWGALSNLATLDASFTSLSGTLPDALGQWTAITSLMLDNNALQGSIPTTFASLTALTTLMLSQNLLSGSLAQATLCPMAALTYLDLSSNGISGTIPDLSCSARQQQPLKYLDLRNNALTGTSACPRCGSQRSRALADRRSALASAVPASLAVALKCSGGIYVMSLSKLGLAGNMLTGAVPTTLNGGGCTELAAQRPVSVCLAGSAEKSGASSFLSFGLATCDSCTDGFFSSSPGAVACTACEPGYYSLPNRTGCLPCDAGTFLNSTGGCQACPPGSSSQRGAVACQACQANTYSASDGTSCTSCPSASTSYVGSPTIASCTCALGSVPQYTSDNSTFTCVQCARGRYHDAAAGVCVACPAGTYTNTAGSYTCIPATSGFMVVMDGSDQAPCPAGTFMNGTSCANCAAGMFAASSGATACAACPPSTVAPSPGALSCAACPANSADADGNTVCVCASGYYDATRGGADGPDCTLCVDGAACVAGALLAQEGYWRESPTDTVFLKCREGYCLPEEGAASRRRLHQAQQSGHCAQGHSSTLCAVCLDGYTMQGGFCKPCGAGDDWAHWSRASKGVIIAFFVPAGLLLVALLLLLPLLPGWERAMWRVTTGVAAAAEMLLGCASGLKRRCCGGAAEEEAAAETLRSGGATEEAASRRISRRVSVTRTSTVGHFAMLPFHPQASVRLASPAVGDAAAEVGLGSVDALLEAATELLIALLRPGKILINVRCSYRQLRSLARTLYLPRFCRPAVLSDRVHLHRHVGCTVATHLFHHHEPREHRQH